MNCPNCGTPERARVRECAICGKTYASQDLLEYRQLQFLIGETMNWVESDFRRRPYIERFTALKERLLHQPATQAEPSAPKPEPKPAPAPSAPATTAPPVPTAQSGFRAPAAMAAPKNVTAAPATPLAAEGQKSESARPKAEAVPFDQWLLSERNIKFALYSGGLLLFLAGIIYAGINWNLLGGPVKLAFALFYTAALYVGGFWLMKRPFLKIGGIALLTIASGFVPLNFMVLQLYITSGLGVSNETMWIAASLISLAIYIVTALSLRTTPVTYLALAAGASALTAALTITHAALLVFVLGYSLLALGYLLLARAVAQTQFADFMRTPLLVVSQAAAPLLFLASAVEWARVTNCPACAEGNPWLALAGMFIGVGFYAATDWLVGWRIARWIVGGLFGWTLLFAMFQLHWELPLVGFAATLAACGYLALAYAIEKVRGRPDALPFLVEAQFAMPGLLVIDTMIWLNRLIPGGPLRVEGNPWLALAALFVGVGFYLASDRLYGWMAARWAAGGLLAFAILFSLFELRWEQTAISFTMTVIACAYLALAYVIEHRPFLPALAGGVSVSSPARDLESPDGDFSSQKSLLEMTPNQMTLNRQSALPFLAEAQAGALVLLAANTLVWFGGRDFSSTQPWVALAGLFLLAGFYAATDLLYHWIQARWAAGAVLAGAILFSLIQLHWNLTSVAFAMTLLAGAYLALAYAIEGMKSHAEALPFYTESQMAMPLLVVANAVAWITGVDHLPWLALGGLFLTVTFYIATDALFRALAARWASAFLFAVTVVFTLSELHFTAIQTGLALKFLALVYLGIGLLLERREGSRAAGLPLYAAGYLIAAFVTAQSLAQLPRGQFDLALALIGDTLILAVSARVHRSYAWMYGAVFLFIAPVYIFLRLYTPGLLEQGMGLAALMTAYTAAGYGLDRLGGRGNRASKWGGPFLAAAAFLSAFVWLMTLSNAMATALILVLIAALYVCVSVSRKWEWLLLPALGAIDLAAIFGVLNFINLGEAFFRALTIAYAGISIALVGIAYALVVAKLDRWRLPLYVVALGNFGLAFLAAIYFRGTLGAALAVAFAATTFGLAGFERGEFARLRLPPLGSYAGAVLVTLSLLFAIEPTAWRDIWTALTAGLAAVLIAAALGLRPGWLDQMYGIPLRRVGLALMLASTLAMAILSNILAGAVTFGIAGSALGADAWARKKVYQAYLGAGTFVVVIWYLLQYWGIQEAQAYMIPFGLWLIGAGLSERRRERDRAFTALTVLGFGALMGSAFYQSLNGLVYSVLLLAESLIAFFLGVRIRSRVYVQVALASMIVNGLAQFGPGFAHMDRWFQLGIIGAILLIAGIAALFQRERLLSARRNLADEWRQWGA